MTRPLRIGVDARELLGDTTGVGRYLGELIRRWVARDDASKRRFLLYSPAALALPCPGGTTEPRILRGGAGTWWEQTTLRRTVGQDRPDVFFAPAYTAPLAIGVPVAVTIHDVSFIAHPEWFRPRERWRRGLITRRTVAAAHVVLTVSQFSRGEIERLLHVSRSRIRVIYPGVGIRDLGPGTGDAGVGAQGLGLGARDSGLGVPGSGLGPQDSGVRSGRERIVLYVGSIFNRRRLPDLIAAFAAAASDMPDTRLVIVGADRTWPAQDLEATAAGLGVGPKVEVRRYVSEDELRGLYARASVFAFLSEYEGFGLTVLEALAAGLPAVVLDTSVAREVYGLAACYVPPGDIPATAAALRGFLTSPGTATPAALHTPEVLARYSWDRAAEETLDAIESIVR